MGAYSPYLIHHEMEALPYTEDRLSSLFISYNGTRIRLEIETILSKPSRETQYYAVYPYPYGKILIVWEPDGAIVDLSLSKESQDTNFGSPHLVQATHKVQQEEHLELIRLLFSEKSSTEINLKLRLYSPSTFYLKVWRSLTAIPLGSVVSYKHIAQLIGYSSGYQAIGQAVGANPISVLLPCHRVVQSDGNLGGYAHGPHIKEQLLRLELK